MKILCLHRVVPEFNELSWPYQIRGTAITIGQLDRLLTQLKQRYRPISPDEFEKVIRRA